MKSIKYFGAILEVGGGRDTAVARTVTIQMDDAVHKWLVPHKMRKFYFDRWGMLRLRATHTPLLRIINPGTPDNHTLRCLNGDRFDYRRHNWRAEPFRRSPGRCEPRGGAAPSGSLGHLETSLPLERTSSHPHPANTASTCSMKGAASQA